MNDDELKNVATAELQCLIRPRLHSPVPKQTTPIFFPTVDYKVLSAIASCICRCVITQSVHFYEVLFLSLRILVIYSDIKVMKPHMRWCSHMRYLLYKCVDYSGWTPVQPTCSQYAKKYRKQI